MKKYLILLLMISAVVVQAQPLNKPMYDALSFKGKDAAQQGQSFAFSFDQKMSPLKNENNIDIAIYQFNGKSWKVTEPVIKKTGTIYSSTIMIDNDATALGFSITNGDNRDDFGGKGYLVPVKGKDGRIVQGWYRSAGLLQMNNGEQLFGITKNPQKAVDLMEEGMKAYPAAKNDLTYTSAYYSAIGNLNKPDSKATTLAWLDGQAARSDLSETDYGTIVSWYSRLKMKAKADSLTAMMKQKFPAGDWKLNESVYRLVREKSADKKVAMYDSIVAATPADKLDANMKTLMKSQIASAYTKEKNTVMFAKWTADLPMQSKASAYNDVSWNMAEAGENMTEAKRMSEEATMWAKNEVKSPKEKKPESITKKQWEDERNSTYGMYADTYAFILYQNGDYKTGLPYAKDGATSRKMEDPELNERYAMLLAKGSTPAVAKPIIEDMVKAGKASAKTKDALKELYVKEHGSDAGFDKYVVALEEAAAKKKKEEIAKSMINRASPKFALKDWEGNEVSLESLKGKIVVVDFWATWCGPCIASMPGMKKAQEKLASRDDVKFLFIDTWETVDNKLTNSKDFMAKKKYPFYVLMDNEDKMVKDFEVSGIPTKFILDKEGNIRFKAVGFEGNTDALAEEVMTMVEMAGGK